MKLVIACIVVAFAVAEARHHFRHQSDVDLSDLEDYLDQIHRKEDAFRRHSADEYDMEEEIPRKMLRDALKRRQHHHHNSDENMDSKEEMLRDAFRRPAAHHKRSHHQFKDADLDNLEENEIEIKKAHEPKPTTPAPTTTPEPTTTTTTPTTTPEPKPAVHPVGTSEPEKPVPVAQNRVMKTLMDLVKAVKALQYQEHTNRKALYYMHRQIVALRKQADRQRMLRAYLRQMEMGGQERPMGGEGELELMKHMMGGQEMMGDEDEDYEDDME